VARRDGVAGSAAVDLESDHRDDAVRRDASGVALK
jgi:hypothetical protein